MSVLIDGDAANWISEWIFCVCFSANHSAPNWRGIACLFCTKWGLDINNNTNNKHHMGEGTKKCYNILHSMLLLWKALNAAWSAFNRFARFTSETEWLICFILTLMRINNLHASVSIGFDWAKIKIDGLLPGKMRRTIFPFDFYFDLGWIALPFRFWSVYVTLSERSWFLPIAPRWKCFIDDG